MAKSIFSLQNFVVGVGLESIPVEPTSFATAAKGQLPPERGTIFRIKASLSGGFNVERIHHNLWTQAILAVKGHPYKHVFHAVLQTCFACVFLFVLSLSLFHVSGTILVDSLDYSL